MEVKDSVREEDEDNAEESHDYVKELGLVSEDESSDFTVEYEESSLDD